MLFFLLEKETPEMYFEPPGPVFPRYFESGTVAKIHIFPRSPHSLTLSLKPSQMQGWTLEWFLLPCSCCASCGPWASKGTCACPPCTAQVWEGLADFKAYLRKKKNLFLSIGIVIDYQVLIFTPVPELIVPRQSNPSSLHMDTGTHTRIFPSLQKNWLKKQKPQFLQGAGSCFKRLDMRQSSLNRTPAPHLTGQHKQPLPKNP